MDSKLVGVILMVLLKIVVATNDSAETEVPTFRQSVTKLKTFTYTLPGAGIPSLRLPMNCRTNCEAAVDFDSAGTGPVHFRVKGQVPNMYVLVGLSNSRNLEEDIFGVGCIDLGPGRVAVFPVRIDSSNRAVGFPESDPVFGKVSSKSSADTNGFLECSFDIDLEDISFKTTSFSRNTGNKLYILLNTGMSQISEPYVSPLNRTDPAKTIVSEFYFQRGRVVNLISEVDPIVDLKANQTNKGHESGHPFYGSLVFIVIRVVLAQNIF